MNIKEIAEKANVSKSAVSIALNNKSGISDATREKILAIVKETGYRHRSMVDIEKVFGEKKILRLLACNKADIYLQYATSSFFTDLIHCIEKHAKEFGYALVFSTIDIEVLEEEIIELEKRHPSDGIILLATNLNNEEIDLVSKVQKNILVLDNFMEFYDRNVVVMDNIMGAFEAVSYLVGIGHRKIGYVRSSVRLANFDQRKEGFDKALKHFDINAFDYDFTVNFYKENAKEQLEAQINENEGNLPTALFCECDYIAIDLIKALKQTGYKIPEDISVIGFDNVTESSVVSPELTTVNVFKDKMAELAVKNLLKAINDGNHVKTKSVVNTELIIRNSCAPVE